MDWGNAAEIGAVLVAIAAAVTATAQAARSAKSAARSEMRAQEVREAISESTARSATAHETIAVESARRDAEWDVINEGENKWYMCINRTGFEARNVNMDLDSDARVMLEGAPFESLSPGAYFRFGHFRHLGAKTGLLTISWTRPDGTEGLFKSMLV